MALRIERYKNTRHWALYDGAELVVVTVYKRGAQAVQPRLAAQPKRQRAAAAQAQARGSAPEARHQATVVTCPARQPSTAPVSNPHLLNTHATQTPERWAAQMLWCLWRWWRGERGGLVP